MAHDLTRRSILGGTIALGALGYRGGADHALANPATPRGGPMSIIATRYIGASTSRVDGRAKVTGAAKYAAEFNVPNLAHGYVLTSRIARGRIARVDTSAALRVPGVFDVLSHEHRPEMAGTDEAYNDDAAPPGSPYRPLYDGRIWFSGQPVALVLAGEWETARFAASLVRVDYIEEEPATDIYRQAGEAFPLGPDTFSLRGVKPRGDASRALAAADVRHAADYYVPIEHHNPMELYASTVVRESDGKLTVYDKTQGVQNVQRYLCAIFNVEPGDLRVLSPFMGGGFGSGLRPQFQAVLAVLGALALKRSVRVVLTRPQMYALGHRPGTIERVALGANSDGALDALTFQAIGMTSRYEAFARRDGAWATALYKVPNSTITHELVRLDLPTSCDMRGPGAASGVYALECAMDELAVALKIDPLELRLRNYSERDLNEDLPYSSKELRACYQQGAEAFGWSRRNPEPRSMRDGNNLVGWGMATGVWEALYVKITTRVVFTANGHAEVSSATSDIGTGTYTIMTQVAAEMLGLPLENVTAKLGDSSLPQSPLEGGSWIAASVSNAIAITCRDVRGELLSIAKTMPGSPLSDAGVDDVTLSDGKIVSKRDANRAVIVADVMRHGGIDRIEKTNGTDPQQGGKFATGTHSAVFAEVKVDEQLGVVRVTRVVDAVAAGRILNTKTASSQIMGGVVWGIGMALHEETLIDHKFGRVMNADIAEYHVPVNADVHDIKVIFVEEHDDVVNPMGIKGVGEIGIVGVAAAIANAVYHATGKRVRDLPITLDKVHG
jgi:xanthine dehydrogenase YagR molybdenum-binding subunit